MPAHSPREVSDARGDSRWIAGLLVAADGCRISGTLARVEGRGTKLRAEAAAMRVVRAPPETVALLAGLAYDNGGEPGLLARIAALRSQLAELEAGLIIDLVSEAGLSRSQLLAVGVHDPGLWSCGKTTGYLGLCEAARLVELTGVNVIESFSARDLAAGGMGGPVTALAEWLLLSDPRRNRCLLDLGRTTHLTYLPASHASSPAARIIAFDVGPGTRLLDLLAQKLTSGECRCDPGGRFAVQGRRIPELIDHWLADPYFRTPLPRWQPYGVRPERFLVDALRRAVDSGWSVRDLLCSATHFLAEAIAQAVSQRLPEDWRIDEILLIGGGQQNGMLLREISVRLPKVAIRRVAEYGATGEMLGPATVALLASFHLDQVPASLPAVTGAQTTRVLGRLTPGSPASWQRLLEHCGVPPPVTLRKVS